MILLRNFLNFLIFLIINLFIGLKKIKITPKTILLLRLDSIGDYVLFRNFIRILKEDKNYKDHKFTLCGNLAWKELAETFDQNFIDEFIWIDRKKFLKSIRYKYSILKIIHRKGFETVINSTFTREILFGDQIVKASNSKNRIGSISSPEKRKRIKYFTDNFYTELISTDEKNVFEFYRNLNFFEKYLSKKINLEKPSFNTANVNNEFSLPSKYIVIFPGANEIVRRWPPKYFAETVKHLIGKYNSYIIIPGGPGDSEISEQIIKLVNSEKTINLTGNVPLSMLVKIIADSDLLIANDTGAIHIAAAVETEFICISNGYFLGRFHPYPVEIFNKANYVYPEEISNIDADPIIVEKLRSGSYFNIDKIKPSVVVKIADQIINKLNSCNV